MSICDQDCARPGVHHRSRGCRPPDYPVLIPGPPDDEVKRTGVHVGRCDPVGFDWIPSLDGGWDMWRYPDGRIMLTVRL